LKGSKPHAYIINEVKVMNREALSGTNSGIREAGGQPTGVFGQKIVARIGEAPKAITLWGFSSLEQAEAYLKSPTYATYSSQLDKAVKITPSYIVEAAQ
jgi:uncharacterized protein (DUF1330 family)